MLACSDEAEKFFIALSPPLVRTSVHDAASLLTVLAQVRTARAGDVVLHGHPSPKLLPPPTPPSSDPTLAACLYG